MPDRGRFRLTPGHPTLANGALVNVGGQNQILWQPGKDSAVHTYDAAGNLVMKAYEGIDGGLKLGDRTFYSGQGQALTVLAEDTSNPNQLYVKEKRTYDLNGRETELRTYYELGKEKTANGVTMNVEGWLKAATLSTYDADGRLTEVNDWNRRASWFTYYTNGGSGGGPNDQDDHDSNHDEVTDLTLTAWTKYVKSGDSSFGYDAAGNLKKFEFRKDHQNEGETGVNYTHTFTYAYRAGEGYDVLSIDGVASQVSEGGFAAADSAATFDTFGRRTSMNYDVANGSTKKEEFSFDGEGREVYVYGRAKNSVRPSIHYTWANGELLGKNYEDGGVLYKWGGQTSHIAPMFGAKKRKADFTETYDVTKRNSSVRSARVRLGCPSTTDRIALTAMTRIRA